MDSFRKQLDALMGANRNGDVTEVKRKYYDRDVCRLFLAGLCPHDLFQLTKMDLGACPKVHSLQLRKDYEDAKAKGKDNYDREMEDALERHIGECERKITRALRRLDDDDAKAATAISVSEVTKSPEVEDYTKQIKEKLKEAEYLDLEGRSDDKIRIMEQVEELRAKRADKQAMLLLDAFNKDRASMPQPVQTTPPLAPLPVTVITDARTQDMIIEKLKKAEELGEMGRVDEAQKFMEEAEALKKLGTREVHADSSKITAVDVRITDQKLRVCDICGAFLSIYARMPPIRYRLTFLTENAKYSRELEAAVDVVQKACRLCVEVQKQLLSKDRGIVEKGDRTPVTIADFGVQALISMELSRLFPSIPLVAEEDSSQLLVDLENSQQNGASDSLVEAVMNAVTNSVSLQAEPLNYDQILTAIDRGGQERTSEENPATYWVLDPIDGTRGFVRGGKALYVVGLALVVEGNPTLGVMGCPNWDADSTYIVQKNSKEITKKNEPDDFIIPGIIMAACYGCGTWMKNISCNTINVAVDGSHNGWFRYSVDKCDSFQAAHFCIGDHETWELVPLSKTLAADAISEGSVKSWKPTIVPTCCRRCGTMQSV